MWRGTKELAAGALVADFLAGDSDSAAYGFALLLAPPDAAFLSEKGIARACGIAE